jgi:glycosyltransferase involved in cell wall biosynthesis
MLAHKKLSIVAPVLDSHEIVQRLVKYYKNLDLPEDIEIIIIDDNSTPPLRESIDTMGLKNFYIFPTGDTRTWTIACARNLGVRIALGEYIFNLDVDHFPSMNAIEAAYNFTSDRMHFRRQYGILNKDGILCQNKETLFKYGLSQKHWRKHNVKRYGHIVIHCMPKTTVIELGGYPEFTCNAGHHPTREDQIFYRRFEYYMHKGYYKNIEPGKVEAPVYCFPEECQQQYFHRLPKKTVSRRKVKIHENIHYHPSPEQP